MPVADVSEAILEVLRQGIPPLISREQIGLCSPGDPGDNFLLGLHVYSITRDNKFQMIRNLVVDSNTSRKPPLCVEISFVVTPYLSKKSGLSDDYKLLDRVLQIWHDNGAIPYESALQPGFVPLPRVELISLDPDTISKIWQFPNEPYRTSLFYKAAPVAIPATLELVTPRVREAVLEADERRVER